MDRLVKELEYCTYCPKMCRHVCPVSNATGCETVIPQAKMHLLNMLRRTAIPWELDYVRPAYACTGCRLCQQFCQHGTDVAAALQHGRSLAQQRRVGHPALAHLPERFRTRNVKLQAKIRREFSAHLFAEEAEVAFFPGCETIDCFIDDIRDAFTVFDALSLNFVRLADMPHVCFGHPLWTGGFVDAARFVAQEMVQSVRRFAKIIVGCPACTHLLRHKLPEEGFEHNTEVLHISEFLHAHVERLPIQRTRRAAFYHDPCYLGRYLGVYEQPRRLLSRCVGSIKEFFYSREEGECCGGGGLVPHTYPEAAAGQARRRLAEARLFDVPLIVSSCPTCKRTLAATGVGEGEGGEVEVLDLINLLAWSLREPDRPALPSD